MTTQEIGLNRAGSRVLTDWRPEDAAFWTSTGRSIANRNLWISIPCLFLAFAVWVVWSAVTVRLNNVGFHFSVNELFWLASLPGLTGATLRGFYSFLIPVFGGRLWTTISTLSLLIPAGWMGFAVQDPTTPYSTFLIIALLCGLGGGNFASSMANISFFFPKAQQGAALGLYAGLGNLGVSAAQFIVPLVITMAAFGTVGGAPQLTAKGAEMWLQNAGFIWVPFILLAAIAAWFGMNDIASARASFRDQASIFACKHNYLMCWLYLATFGSFIGYSAGFPMLISTQFPDVDPLRYAFLGPLVGALIRPVGGWLSDRLGGARVTFWNFVVMIAAVGGVLYALPDTPGQGSFALFLGLFMLLFVTTGVGNGSTFRMIPIIYRVKHTRLAEKNGNAADDDTIRAARRESAAVLGFSSAIGAFGGFFIPKSYGTSIALTGGPEGALIVFAAFYLTCLGVTWWWYHRAGAEVSC